MASFPGLTYDPFDYKDAACVGKHELFDSVDLEDEDGVYIGEVFPHEGTAKALCKSCPMLAQCEVDNWELPGTIIAGRTPKERRRKKR